MSDPSVIETGKIINVFHILTYFSLLFIIVPSKGVLRRSSSNQFERGAPCLAADLFFWVARFWSRVGGGWVRFLESILGRFLGKLIRN